MVISSVLPTNYSGMFKIQPEEGASFYIREAYLFSIKVEDLTEGYELSGEKENELLDAGLAAAVEFKAASYLARCEQSRFGLSKKLFDKGYEKKYINMALDFLESRNFLSDKRFASAWLLTRRLNHYEGRSKLLMELTSRGISKETANESLDEFFKDYDEFEIAKKAWAKFIKAGKSEEKLIGAMMNAGFSYKMIKMVKEENYS